MAIRRSCERRARRSARKQVEAALERAGAASLQELAEITGLRRDECGRAIDELRIAGRVVEEPEGIFRWAAEGVLTE